MIAIEPTRLCEASALRQPPPAAQRAAFAPALLLVLIVVFLSAVSPAIAGQASTGKLAFDPCDRCHPVFIGADGNPTKPLPSGFKKHQIELEAHDILGKGDAACTVCHDQPTKNPGMLLTADGTRVYVTGDVSRVCQRCHFEKYSEWKAGVHGKNQPKCTAAGCHDAHSPSWIYVAALPPFLGTGIQVKAVGEREAFKPLAAPPVQPPVYTPTWLVVVASLGFLLAFSITGYLIFGRRTR